MRNALCLAVVAAAAVQASVVVGTPSIPSMDPFCAS
jgi:hypothetical protein